MKRIPGNFMLCLVGFVATLMAVAGWGTYTWLAPPHVIQPAVVTPSLSSEAVRPHSTTSLAGLFFTSATPGSVYQAPTLKTDVQFAVRGTVIRATLRQHFYNPSSEWLEGIYVFPLPERSGVDRLRMQIGDRFVEGQIQEKTEARQTYEQARQEGKRAGLVSSARDNIFTTRVANVGPEEEIIIEIQYADTVQYRDHTYSLRFPMVVAPRYVPGRVVFNEQGEVGATEVPDAGEILSPIHDPQQDPINPLTLTIDLNPGFETDVIQSRFHPITVQSGSGFHRLITLADRSIPADRDFVLDWQPVAGAGPTTQLVVEEVGPDIFLHGTVFPPGPAFPSVTSQPRDLTLVVDVSGSMAGTSLSQVKEALSTLFTRLTTKDRFNLITFASNTSQLFPEVRFATESNIDTARRFVARLEADGGTELLPALETALSGDGDDSRLQQVVVLTDGAIGYEEQVFRAIHEHLGTKRLFMVGIGSAPNSFVMREAASMGRGIFTFIGDVRETRERMSALLKKLEHPALTDLAVEWPPHFVAEEPLHEPAMYPSRLPDLFQGDPVTFDVKFHNLQAAQLAGILRITGQNNVVPWIQEIPLQDISRASGVAKLWAREKVAELMSEARRGKLTEEQAQREIVQVALAHQLVTNYTSLVAVDQMVARRPGSHLVTHRLANNLPAGWNFEPVKPGGLLPAWLVQHHGQVPDKVMPLVPAPTLVALALPRTATAARMHLILGFMGLCLFCAAYFLRGQ